MIIKKLKRRIKRYLGAELRKNSSTLNKKLEEIQLQNGKIWSYQLKSRAIENIEEAEFKVFSQWGDDGIIQYLIQQVDIKNKTFIEFGVEDYQESNTRFLMMNNNWSGLVMDGSVQNINKIKSSDYFWKYELKAVHAFITAENVNDLIKNAGFQGEIGLLHIDVDGNDYWIWKAIDVIDPVIAIVEYNSLFGKHPAVTVPYRSDFQRNKAHYSNLFAGASLSALNQMAELRDFVFVGCNSAGNNAYFVKKKSAKNLKPLSVEDGYVVSKFRESRSVDGKLNYVSGEQRIEVIKNMRIHDLNANKDRMLNEIMKTYSN